LETPLPDPENSETLEVSERRWRWMENRWLMLLVTVLVSASCYAFVAQPSVMDPAREWMLRGQRWLLMSGIKFPCGVADEVLLACSSLWFYPVALRLGSLRTVIWVGLAALGAQLFSCLWEFFTISGWVFHLRTLPILLPGVALIGRRTRPWMVVPATIAWTYCGAFGIGWNSSFDFFSVAKMSLPYAAILTFGTKLIPKRAAPELPID
jgi:hypothetical protein